MTDPRAVLGAENNADLYATIFLAHGLSFDRPLGGDGFLADDPPPPYYGHAVVTRPGGATALLRAARHRFGDRVAIKDSFLELDGTGLSSLLEASWIWRASAMAATDWTRLDTPDRLAAWEAAWRETSPNDRRMFPSGLLGRDDFAFFAAPDGRSGCIANRSDEAVGLSNVFGPAPFTEAAAAAAALAPALPLVGYESGTTLDEALGAGFTETGRLRVLVPG